MVSLFYENKNNITQKGLACLYYTTFSKNSKKNLLIHEKGEERGTWFIYTLVAIIIPFTSSKTSNLLRCLKSLFGFTGIRKKRYYTFMASPKIPWQRLWQCLWKMIPDPLTNDRLLLALDDYINPKTGRKIFGCDKIFDHAAKQNQSRYPWAQNIVAIGLLKVVQRTLGLSALEPSLLPSEKKY